jgi:hypothetical protein
VLDFLIDAVEGGAQRVRNGTTSINNRSKIRRAMVASRLARVRHGGEEAQVMGFEIVRSPFLVYDLTAIDNPSAVSEMRVPQFPPETVTVSEL